MFNFGDQPAPEIKDTNLGFAGFRIHGPINRPDYFDEIGVFSARAISAPSPRGRSTDFRRRTFDQYRRPEGRGIPDLQDILGSSGRPRAPARSWCMRCSTARAPRPPTASPSDGDTTVYDIEVALFPRVNIEQPGLATLTSMFFFRPERPRRRRRFPSRRA